MNNSVVRVALTLEPIASEELSDDIPEISQVEDIFGIRVGEYDKYFLFSKQDSTLVFSVGDFLENITETSSFVVSQKTVWGGRMQERILQICTNATTFYDEDCAQLLQLQTEDCDNA